MHVKAILERVWQIAVKSLFGLLVLLIVLNFALTHPLKTGKIVH